jgi:hypothetical protein
MAEYAFGMGIEATRIAAACGRRGSGRAGVGPRLARARWFGTRAAHLFASGALVAGVLVLAPAAQGRGVANPTLDVTFSSGGTIAVTLPDGTPVGSSSGTPTAIPAGYYSVVLTAPGECVQVPLFTLSGPGADLQSDMSGGEVNTEVHEVYLEPSSTYTWTTFGTPAVNTFVTSSQIEGAQSGYAPSGASGTSSGSAPSSSENIVGTAVASSVAARLVGTLSGTVSAAGKVTLDFKGRGVANLTTGRYTLTVTDRSTKRGFMLQRRDYPAQNLTGAPFVGKKSTSVDLTAGQWSYGASPQGKKTYFVVH